MMQDRVRVVFGSRIEASRMQCSIRDKMSINESVRPQQRAGEG